MIQIIKSIHILKLTLVLLQDRWMEIMSHSLKIYINKTLYDKQISTYENGPLELIDLNTKS